MRKLRAGGSSEENSRNGDAMTLWRAGGSRSERGSYLAGLGVDPWGPGRHRSPPPRTPPGDGDDRQGAQRQDDGAGFGGGLERSGDGDVARFASEREGVIVVID